MMPYKLLLVLPVLPLVSISSSLELPTRVRNNHVDMEAGPELVEEEQKVDQEPCSMSMSVSTVDVEEKLVMM